MKHPLLRRSLVFAVCPLLALSACKQAPSASSGHATVSTEAKEEHTKGHKKKEKKEKKEEKKKAAAEGKPTPSKSKKSDN